MFVIDLMDRAKDGSSDGFDDVARAGAVRGFKSGCDGFLVLADSERRALRLDTRRGVS